MKHTTLPFWARKPEHPKEVIATPRGWMVKDTGEMLKMVRNLDQKLKALKVEIDDIVIQEPEEERVDPPVVDDEPVQVAESEPNVEDAPKRRGRPRKQAPQEK